MPQLRELGDLVTKRFEQHVRALDPATPPHRVEFSARITESWALIYYRRHLVRLSPYLFLLDPSELKHPTHWAELDATLRHEAAHAVTFHRHGETGHDARFHQAIAGLGLQANGRCDLGPENAAFRYVYACPTCGAEWLRRVKLKRNWSCGECAPGRFDPTHMIVLREKRHLPSRLRARSSWIAATLAEARAALDAETLSPKGAV